MERTRSCDGHREPFARNWHGQGERILFGGLTLGRAATTTMALASMALTVSCGSKQPEDVKVDLSTPAGVGRTLCAAIVSGRTELLGQLQPWEQQIKACNFMEGMNECAGEVPCAAITEKRTYPSCSEKGIADFWRLFSDELKRTKSPCLVERPQSGELAEIEIVSFEKTRDVVKLKKLDSGLWEIDTIFILPKARAAAGTKAAQKLKDRESGFDKQ